MRVEDLQPKLTVRSAEAVSITQTILQDLQAMLQEEDEPDFLHCPTEYAYDSAKRMIEELDTHDGGSAPTPTIAPDGEGGIIAEWKSGDRIVRMIIPPRQDRRSYVYSREPNRSQIDYTGSGLVLAQQLCSIFAD